MCFWLGLCELAGFITTLLLFRAVSQKNQLPINKDKPCYTSGFVAYDPQGNRTPVFAPEGRGITPLLSINCIGTRILSKKNKTREQDSLVPVWLRNLSVSQKSYKDFTQLCFFHSKSCVKIAIVREKQERNFRLSLSKLTY